MTLTFAGTGDVELTVRALYDGEFFVAGTTPYLVGLDTFEANVTEQFDVRVFVGVDLRLARPRSRPGPRPPRSAP